MSWRFYSIISEMCRSYGKVLCEFISQGSCQYFYSSYTNWVHTRCIVALLLPDLKWCIWHEKPVARKGFLGRDVTETSISSFTSVSNLIRNVLLSFTNTWGFRKYDRSYGCRYLKILASCMTCILFFLIFDIWR